MNAISLRQPWCWAITHLPSPIAKRLENRVWRQLRNRFEKIPVKEGEVIALHASKTKPKDHDWDGVEAAIGRKVTPEEEDLINRQRGHITGIAKVFDVIRTDAAMTIVEDAHFPRYKMLDVDYTKFMTAYGDMGLERQREQIERWWLGPYAFWLGEVVALQQALPAGGALYFWEVDKDTEGKIRVDVAHRAIAIGGMTIPVKVDPTMPPGVAELRSGDQVVRIVNLDEKK